MSADGELLTEPDLKEKAQGELDIELPDQVPEGRIFGMGIIVLPIRIKKTPG